MANVRRIALPEAFLLALGGILLEIGYSRILSFKLVDPFPAIVFALAMLGLGVGGILVAVVGRFRLAVVERAVPALCLAASLAVLGGFAVIARVQLDSSDIVDAVASGAPGLAASEWFDLALTSVALFIPFLATGMALATIFGASPRHLGLLYGADLVGAAAGSALAVPLLSHATPPGLVMVAGACFALAALPFAARRFSGLVVPAAIACSALGAFALLPGLLPDPLPDRVKAAAPVGGSTPGIVYSAWSPLARIEVRRSASPGVFLLSEDGAAESEIERAEIADTGEAERHARSERAIALRVVGGAPEVLLVRPSGNGEVRAALALGAKHVTVIEPDPVRYGVQRGDVSSIGSASRDDPRVTMVNGEGRAFVRSPGPGFDLLWVVLPDGDAALRATPESFAPSQRAPVTVEAVQDGLARLKEGGIAAVQIGDDARKSRPRRLLRFLATAREALERSGIADASSSVMVATSDGRRPGSVLYTVLLRREPFGEAQIDRFRRSVAEAPGGRVIHDAGLGQDGGDVSHVLRMPSRELAAWLAGQSEDLAPVHDDRPFFGHFARFRDVLRGRMSSLPVEEGVAEMLLPAFLGLTAVVAGLLLLSPLATATGALRSVRGKLARAVYFSALGAGFMLVEIGLMNHFNRLLGYPTRAISVTLCALLLSSGIGSMLVGRFTRIRLRALAVVGTIVFTVVAATIAFVEPALGLLESLPLALRVLVVAALVMPLGLALGMLLPIGLEELASAAPERRDVIAWGWAVNGFASVVGSVAATILAMAFGFDTTLLIAIAVYWIGIAALLRVPEAAAAEPA